MKLITAIIQPEALDKVREALIEAEITRITVSRCAGHGQAQVEPEIYRGHEVKPNLIPKVRIDIAVNEEFVDSTIKAITSGARSGNIGDGKIIVTPIDQIVRIRTSETGSAAI